MDGTYGNLIARNKGEILSIYGGSATKMGMSRECHINQLNGHVEEGDVEQNEDESEGKGDAGLNLSILEVTATLGDCKNRVLTILHEIEMLQAVDCVDRKPTTFCDLESQSKQKIVTQGEEFQNNEVVEAGV